MSALDLASVPQTSAYRAALPYPHAVLDGLFFDALLEAALADFPALDEDVWVHFDNPRERKHGYRLGSPLRTGLRDLLSVLNSARFVTFLELLTGIPGLVPDPDFGGAGPTLVPPGGLLEVHADFNWHPVLEKHRRLNVLVYLNPEWREEWGGHLELWNAEATRCERRILPSFNRTVVFDTGERSFHGHPAPLACPTGHARRSVSAYYYSSEPPPGDSPAPHDTIFRTLETR